MKKLHQPRLRILFIAATTIAIPPALSYWRLLQLEDEILQPLFSNMPHKRIVRFVFQPITSRCTTAWRSAEGSYCSSTASKATL